MDECPGYTETGKGVVTRGSEIENDNKRAIKKFLHRLKETAGIAERTKFSKKLSDAMEHMDRYKLCLDQVSDALYKATQENGRFRVTNYKEQIALYQRQATEHRDYLQRARRALHNIRSFVQHEYWVIALQRTELGSLRREMDFAKADLEATKEPKLIESKTKVYNKAAADFEKKLAEVTSLMDGFPKIKILHVADILDWAKCTRQYHEEMAKLLDKNIKKVT
uniref:BAR domain-containing protein n=1 Tax=Angiostrongylus cantonensis TaxID=6313 RepID=A0A158P913_ANGCA